MKQIYKPPDAGSLHKSIEAENTQRLANMLPIKKKKITNWKLVPPTAFHISSAVTLIFFNLLPLPFFLRFVLRV